MRESIAQLTPRLSASRAVCEYTDRYYLPAASAYIERAVNQGAIGVDIVNWLRALEQEWRALRFGEVTLETDGEQRVFEVQIYFNELDPQAVRVELYANGVNGSSPQRVEMVRVLSPIAATACIE